MMGGLARDVRTLLNKRPDLRVVFLADGAPELWNLYDRHLSENAIGVRAIRLVDCWHVLEYLGKAATLMETRGKGWPGQLRRWKALLFEKPRAAVQIVEELEASGGVTHLLSVNFRSPPPILREVERVIEPVMQRRVGRQRDGSVRGRRADVDRCSRRRPD